MLPQDPIISTITIQGGWAQRHLQSGAVSLCPCDIPGDCFTTIARHTYIASWILPGQASFLKLERRSSQWFIGTRNPRSWYSGLTFSRPEGILAAASFPEISHWTDNQWLGYSFIFISPKRRNKDGALVGAYNYIHVVPLFYIFTFCGPVLVTSEIHLLAHWQANINICYKIRKSRYIHDQRQWSSLSL